MTNSSKNQKHVKTLIAFAIIIIVGLVPVVTIAQTPTLGNYPNIMLIAGTNTTVTPNAAPTNTLRAVAFASTDFTGVLTVNPTSGVVTVTDAKQAGTYTVTVTVYGGVTFTASANFTLTVSNPSCSQGLFTNAAEANTNSIPYCVAVGDFNNDGNQDIVSAIPDDNSVLIHIGDGAGNFFVGASVPVGISPRWVSVGDFNGDGNEDIASANGYGSSASIRLGDGNGGFSGSTEVPVGINPYCVAIGDFNSDGKQDIAVVNAGSDNVSISIGDGSGNFSGNTQLSVGSSPFSTAIGDFNNDGNQDLAVANGLSNSVSIRIGDGSGNFTGSLDIATNGTGVSNVQIGDFNNDGDQDIVATNQTSSSISIIIGNGLGGFVFNSVYSVGSYPWSVAVGDFNGDGKHDIATANYGNDVTELLGDGSGGFSTSINVSVGNHPLSVAVGDFNNDGNQDLAVTNFGSNTVSIRLGGSAEINVTGNSFSIADGDITPSATDGSDFGQPIPAVPVIHTFNIENSGTTILTVSSLSISGADASNFTISGINTPLNIAPSSSASFLVTFVATPIGNYNAVVNINNNDCDEAAYDFAVHGGFSCQSAAFSVCPSNISINNTTNQCSATVSYTATANGFPVPAITYAFNGATTGSGSGTGSGSIFNKGVTSVTINGSNACGNVNCVFTVTVNDNQTPVITGITKPSYCGYNIHCNGGCEGSATVTATDNCQSAVSYLWSNNQTTATATGLCAGTYTVTVSDGTNSVFATTTITQPDVFIATATSSNPLIFYGYTVDQSSPISVTTSGGDACSKTYSWTMSRALRCNMINSSGDEMLTGSWTSSCAGDAFFNDSITRNPGTYSGSGFIATLTKDANFTVVATTTNGCTASSTIHIDAIDSRCFAGNSGNVKVQMCHHTGSNSNPYVTICVDQNAVSDLLALGDCIGPCSAYANPLNCAGYKMSDVNASTGSGIVVYPNPTSTSVTLQFDGSAEGKGHLIIFDFVGQEVLSKALNVSAGDNRYQLDLSSFSKGIYSIRVIYNGMTRNEKLIVQ